MTDNAHPSTSPEVLSSIQWHQIWAMLLRRLWLFLLCFGTVVALTIVYLIQAPRIYLSSAAVQVEQQEQRIFKTPDENSGSAGDLRSDDAVKTIEQNLQNYSLFVDAVSDPTVANDPNFLVGYPSKDRPVPIPDEAKWLRANTQVSLRHGTRLIDVSVEHQVPEMAQKLVQALINAFLQENSRVQGSTEQAAVKYLVIQSQQVQQDLQQSENSLQIYRDALLLKDRIEDQHRVLDALRQRYREKHPQLIQAKALLADLMQTFDQEFKRVLASSTSEAAYWAANSNELSTVPAADRIATELKLVEARANVLQMEVDTQSALFDNVVKQMREANVGQNAAPTEVHLQEPPNLPIRTIKPRKAVDLAIGMVIGALLGTVVVFAANAIDSSIKTSLEAESALGLPVLGVIPFFHAGNEPEPGTFNFALPKRQRDEEQTPSPLVVKTEPSSGAAEGFRSLRAAISLLGKSRDHRSMLFTSALPDEGKTFVCVNYALSLGQIGLKTLLMDMDLRRPSIHRCFEVDNRRGFMEIVTESLPLEKAVHAGIAKNLDVLTSGGRCPNPAELFSGTGFQEVLASALKVYDRVVIDCSPINLVSDSLLIASSIQSVCLVLRAASTSRRDAIHALTLLHRADITPVGVVFNAVPSWSERLYPHYMGKKSSKYRQSYTGAAY
jgi:capsular exopolysaccharide synthesis family protein